jgi:isocitrate dehydrogenase (NAD+)
VNVGLRAALDLYAQVRRASYAGVRSRYEDVDLIIVEHGRLYAGVEFEEAPRTQMSSSTSSPQGYDKIRRDSGISIKPISETGTRQIVQFAFDYTRRNGAGVRPSTRPTS